jgi:hypothetical protein
MAELKLLKPNSLLMKGQGQVEKASLYFCVCCSVDSPHSLTELSHSNSGAACPGLIEILSKIYCWLAISIELGFENIKCLASETTRTTRSEEP